MNIRDKLKKTKQPEISYDDWFEIQSEGWKGTWYCGADVPFSWDDEWLKQCEKNCLRENYKRGFLTKKEYRNELRRLNERKTR